MKIRVLHFGITLMSLMTMLRPSLGFTSLQSRHRSSAAIVEIRSRATAISDGKKPVASEEVTIEVKNGNTISVGSIVRVAVNNLKAYQVPPTARGTFNDEKEFEPAPEDAQRALQNLSIPVGMRGVVIKIINKAASLSANFPIQVKFTPGENTDEGYDTPAPFVMHFGVNEVEGV